MRPHVAVLVLFVILLGCSSGLGITTPDTDHVPTILHPQSESGANRCILGLWDVVFERSTSQLTALPIRTADARFNVTNFLSWPPAGKNFVTFKLLDFKETYSFTYIDILVTLNHPMEGQSGAKYYTAFDVKGSILTKGPAVDNVNENLTYSLNEFESTRLLNPDGYARWWNFPEFNGTKQLFSYQDAYFGMLDGPTATLNPYRLFNSVIPEEMSFYDSLWEYGTDRNCFKPNDECSRIYKLQIPLEPDVNFLKFQYAVDCSWAKGDKTIAGHPNRFETPADFPRDANQYEPFLINVEWPGDPYYIHLDEHATARIEIFDWDVCIWPNPSAMIEIEKIILSTCDECTDYPIARTIEGAELEACRIESDPYMPSSVWEVELEGLIPPEPGRYPVMVTVIKDSNVTYDQGFGSTAPDDPIAAHHIQYVDFASMGASCSSPEIIGAYAYPSAVKPGESVFISARGVGGFPAPEYFLDVENDGHAEAQTFDPLEFEWTFEEEGIHGVMLWAENYCQPGYFELYEPIKVEVTQNCVEPNLVVQCWNYSSYPVGYPVKFSMYGTEGSLPLLYEFDFYDGQGYSEWSLHPEFEHAFDEPGTYYVMVRVENPCGDDKLYEPIEVNIRE